MTPRIEEMRAQIDATPMPAAPAVSHVRGRRALAGGGALGLALAAGAAILALTGSGPRATPAYAAVVHTVGGQRTVTITLEEEQRIGALNARLRADHTRIRVVPIVRGCDAPVRLVSNGRVLPGPPRTLDAYGQIVGGGPVFVASQTIAVDTIPGRTLVIPDSPTGMLSGGGGVVVGPAPACVGIGPTSTVAIRAGRRVGVAQPTGSGRRPSRSTTSKATASVSG